MAVQKSIRYKHDEFAEIAREFHKKLQSIDYGLACIIYTHDGDWGISIHPKVEKEGRTSDIIKIMRRLCDELEKGDTSEVDNMPVN